MKGAFETMFAVVLIAFMCVLGTSYVTASLNTQKAQEFHNSVVSEIEASDFSSSVIESCKDKATENGYTGLEVTMLTSAAGRQYAKVTLNYNYTIPVLNSTMNYSIDGYAR